MDSYGVVGFVRVQPGVRLVNSGSFDCTLGVAGFTRGCLFHSGAHCGSLGSFGVARFIRVRPGIIVGFIRVLWFHACAPSGPLGSFGFVGFIRMRAGGYLVHSGSLDSFGCPCGSFGSFRCALGVVGFIRGR